MESKSNLNDTLDEYLSLTFYSVKYLRIRDRLKIFDQLGLVLEDINESEQNFVKGITKACEGPRQTTLGKMVGNNTQLRTDSLPHFHSVLDNLMKLPSTVKGKLHQNFNSTLSMNISKSYTEHYKMGMRALNISGFKIQSLCEDIRKNKIIYFKKLDKYQRTIFDFESFLQQYRDIIFSPSSTTTTTTAVNTNSNENNAVNNTINVTNVIPSTSFNTNVPTLSDSQQTADTESDTVSNTQTMHSSSSTSISTNQQEKESSFMNRSLIKVKALAKMTPSSIDNPKKIHDKCKEYLNDIELQEKYLIQLRSSIYILQTDLYEDLTTHIIDINTVDETTMTVFKESHLHMYVTLDLMLLRYIEHISNIETMVLSIESHLIVKGYNEDDAECMGRYTSGVSKQSTSLSEGGSVDTHGMNLLESSKSTYDKLYTKIDTLLDIIDDVKNTLLKYYQSTVDCIDIEKIYCKHMLKVLNKQGYYHPQQQQQQMPLSASSQLKAMISSTSSVLSVLISDSVGVYTDSTLKTLWEDSIQYLVSQIYIHHDLLDTYNKDITDILVPMMNKLQIVRDNLSEKKSNSMKQESQLRQNMTKQSQKLSKIQASLHEKRQDFIVIDSGSSGTNNLTSTPKRGDGDEVNENTSNSTTTTTTTTTSTAKSKMYAFSVAVGLETPQERKIRIESKINELEDSERESKILLDNCISQYQTYMNKDQNELNTNYDSSILHISNDLIMIKTMFKNQSQEDRGRCEDIRTIITELKSNWESFDASSELKLYSQEDYDDFIKSVSKHPILIANQSFNMNVVTSSKSILPSEINKLGIEEINAYNTNKKASSSSTSNKTTVFAGLPHLSLSQLQELDTERVDLSDLIPLTPFTPIRSEIVESVKNQYDVTTTTTTTTLSVEATSIGSNIQDMANVTNTEQSDGNNTSDVQVNVSNSNIESIPSIAITIEEKKKDSLSLQPVSTTASTTATTTTNNSSSNSNNTSETPHSPNSSKNTMTPIDKEKIDINMSPLRQSSNTLSTATTTTKNTDTTTTSSTATNNNYNSISSNSSNITSPSKPITNVTPTNTNNSNMTRSNTNIAATSTNTTTIAMSAEDSYELKQFGLASTEKILESFSCALYGKSGIGLIHGRLYLTQYFLAFQGWPDMRLLLKLSDIITYEKMNTLYYIPNAISIKTASEDYFFGSFIDRDPTYTLLMNITQSAKTLRQLYGNDLYTENSTTKSSLVYGIQKNSVSELVSTFRSSSNSNTTSGNVTSPAIINKSHSAESSPLKLRPGTSSTSASTSLFHDEKVTDSVGGRSTGGSHIIRSTSDANIYDLSHSVSNISTKGSRVTDMLSSSKATMNTVEAYITTTTAAKSTTSTSASTTQSYTETVSHLSVETTSSSSSTNANTNANNNHKHVNKRSSKKRKSNLSSSTTTTTTILDFNKLYTSNKVDILVTDGVPHSIADIWNHCWKYDDGYKNFLIAEGDLEINTAPWSTYPPTYVPEDICNIPFTHYRPCSYSHPRTTMLFIGPKNAPATQTHYLYIDKTHINSLLVLTVTQFEGVPLAEYFKVLHYWTFETTTTAVNGNNNGTNSLDAMKNTCKITVGLHIHYIKQTMLKGQVTSGVKDELIGLSKRWITHSMKVISSSADTSTMSESMDLFDILEVGDDVFTPLLSDKNNITDAINSPEILMSNKSPLGHSPNKTISRKMSVQEKMTSPISGDMTNTHVVFHASGSDNNEYMSTIIITIYDIPLTLQHIIILLLIIFILLQFIYQMILLSRMSNMMYKMDQIEQLLKQLKRS